MKKRYSFILSLLLFGGSLLVSSQGFFNESKQALPADLVRKQYLADVAAVQKSIDTFTASLQPSKPNHKTVIYSYKKLREAYKKTEYLFARLNPEYNIKFINGAPLAKMEPHAPSVSVVEPVGLQVIDELLYEDDPNFTEIKKQAESLSKNYKKIAARQSGIPLTDRHIIEALRQQLIRLQAHGMTGFDTPASLLALPDALSSWQAMAQTAGSYAIVIKQQHPALATELNRLFTAGTAFLQKNQNFDSFDRLYFIKDYIDPLYGQLLHLQQRLGVENLYEVMPANYEPALNPLSEHIFGDNFLNKYAYLGTPREEQTPELINLGRMLFFDPVLSGNNKRACASCHQPQKAFTDGQAKSMALDFKGTVNRNSPSLINSVYAGRYFWDLRTEQLEDQMEHVVASHQEFNTDYLSITQKLNESSEYKQLFGDAFANGQGISKNTIATALAAYVGSLNTFNSSVDKYIRHETESLPEDVKRGFNIFMGKAACGTCHFAPLFSGTVPPDYRESESEVLGVAATDNNKLLDSDMGRAAGRLKERVYFYERSFKTATTRNVALTAPYMHNGAYPTLESVMRFYNGGGGAGHGLEVPHQTLSADPLHLSKREVKDVIAFMNALTDTTGLSTRPQVLPLFDNTALNSRTIGGDY